MPLHQQDGLDCQIMFIRDEVCALGATDVQPHVVARNKIQRVGNIGEPDQRF